MKFKRDIFIICLLSVLMAGCKQKDYFAQNYFPENVFSPIDEHNAFINQWYSKQLIALKEPSIYSQKEEDNKKIFRFT